MGELRDARATLRRVITEMGCEPILFEDQTPSPQNPLEQSLELVRQSDIYLGLLDARYSSIVEEEYKLAVQLGRPVWLYIREHHGEKEDEELAGFVSRISKLHTYSRFNDSEDLSNNVREKIAETLARDFLEWPGRADGALVRLGTSLSHLSIGTKLYKLSEVGKLNLRVRGVQKHNGHAVLVLDGGLDLGLRDGFQLKLMRERDSRQELLGKVNIKQVSEGNGPLVCERIGSEGIDSWWDDYERRLNEGGTAPVEDGVFLALQNPEQYLNPELTFWETVSRARRELKQ